MTESTRDLFLQQLNDVLVHERHRAASEGVADATLDALVCRGLIRDRIGGFFSNSYTPGTPDVCGICRGPSGEALCAKCAAARNVFGDQLADRTVLLTYAVGNHPAGRHQSAHHMLTYKGYRGQPPAVECAEDLALMISIVVDMHRSCLQSWLGSPWDSLTFVPSRERPDATHPVANLANAALPRFTRASAMQKFLLTPGDGTYDRHELVADRYTVDERWRSRVHGKHVLIVDDTWTTGASAQGAAIAVKTAGAASATIPCVARWLKWEWGEHKSLIESLTGGFDVLRCPVHGRPCDAATRFRISMD
ncbi:amidophosphoribosyltransferase [Nocardia puris]|uniref:Putative amidophosphoribosyltransferase n=2 Tax=Nocardia puris TaxID=208602 RepID=A0A366DBV5_9NOCA|nr:amidophosphoribosyltransferase [Nocardia puris]MBF6365932.1 amidophosphoribosyltransferase [Nocardia puris]MBF6460425.1 amidophosphoribosyltransferase [Nocardia puris]RBO87425.1 putative amidophosphoribosyltransferase [Nocardia puris]